MAQVRCFPLMLGILVVSILCLSSVSGWSQDDAVGPASQGPDPAYGNCPAPTKSGVSVCQPTGSGYLASPFQVIAAATGGRGEVKRR